MKTRLLAETRRRKVLDWLQEEGSARVRTLADAFGVSEVTMRQDLEKLEADGHIVREHGGDPCSSAVHFDLDCGPGPRVSGPDVPDAQL